MVVHQWRETDIHPALESLGESLEVAVADGVLESAKVFVISNGEAPECAESREQELEAFFPFPIRVLTVSVNEGYGQANNLLLYSLNPAEFDAVLVMNPDVLVSSIALKHLLLRLSGDPACGLVVPRLLDPLTSEDLFGCKRYPSLAVLASRQFPVLQRLPVFRQLNGRYEYQDRNPGWVHRGIELCSGCFMLASVRFWLDVGGFDRRYFMYFEDFDISLRAGYRGWVNVYEPAAVVHHAGGGVARKSLVHRWWFIRSAFRFFMVHGWRLWRVGKDG